LLGALTLALLTTALMAVPALARQAGHGLRASAAATSPPKVTKNPTSVTVEEGQPASFTATASGSPTPTVQWERSTNGGSTWAPVEGATSTTLTIASTSTSESGNQLRASFKNTAGEAASKAATLTVHKAPQVTQQPANQTVEEGQSAVFESSASGFPAPTVQWQTSANGGTTWTNVSGATSNQLTVSGTTTALSGHQYRAVFTNVAGKATSNAATLTVQKKPQVTQQPASTTVNEGQPAKFEAAASGAPTPSIQWERSTDSGTTWAPIEGATSSPYTIASTSGSERGYQFRARFTNAVGEAVTAAATLTVQTPPQVTQQPANQTVEEGQSATFEAAASGFPTPAVQWQTSANNGGTWTNVSGATSNQLTIVNPTTSLSGHQYRAVFTNAAGKATSNAATLTVQKKPQVTQQPASTTVNEGDTASFEAAASGFPTPTVQWELSTDGGASWNPVAGATSTHLTVANTTIAEDGDQYRAVFTNAAGTATSNAATLIVHAPPVVTLNPASTTVEVGEGVTFEAAATGHPTPTVQWENSTNGGTSWSAVAGATSDQLTIAKTVVTENGRQFRAVYTNVAGKATSNSATLTVATNHYAAVAWGQNLYRQLGNGSVEGSIDVPVPVTGLKFVTAVAGGGHHSLALLANGTVQGWGYNEFGQVGDGTTFTRSTPVPVQGLGGAKAIAAGADHSLALLSNGTVMAWGENEFGQLGTGGTAGSEVPVAVKGLSGVRAIAAGGNHSLALLTNGTVMAWGEGEEGLLGNGGTKGSAVPVAVKGLTGVSSIAAGTTFNLAVLSKGGTVEAWGSNVSGQLGNSSVEEGFSAVPVPVEGLSGVAAVATGAQHALAVLTGGTVMAWGEDNFGQLGNGTIKPKEAKPTEVTGLSGVSAISAGEQHSVALLSSGSVMTWGGDKYGQLGNGTMGATSSVPVLVSGLTKAASISAGGFHVLAFGEPVPVVTGVAPKLGPAVGGTAVTITGASFTGATAVRFGSTEATGFTLNSSSSITATAPPGAAGTVDITVTTPAGTSAPRSADRYTYQQPPTVTHLTPKVGPVAGGTTVAITGTEFTGASAVSFGGTPATQYTVTSPTTITAVAPASAAGTVHVTVTNTAGASAATSANAYRYTPTVTSVSPNSGTVAGGVSVTISGEGFAPGATAFAFGTAKAKTVECTSATTCQVTTPPHVAGTVDVIATVNKSPSPKNPPGDQFTFN
jgi:alpha-tubulin suppressor-like RCC1 family protein